MDHDSIRHSNTVQQYVSGSLPTDEKLAFEKHLASCAPCLADVHRTMDTLEIFDRFVTGRLTPAQEEFIVPHYLGCDRCYAKLKETEKVVAALKDAARRGTFRLPQPAEHWSFRDWLDSLFSSRAPIIALASLVLLLLYPSLQWFLTTRTAERQLRELQHPIANAPRSFALTLSDDGTRGVAEKIELTAAEKFFTLSFNVSAKLDTQSRYRAEIFDSSGKLVWQIDGLQPAGEYDTFSITCLRSSFTPANYLLKLHILSADRSPSDKTFSYPFEIQFKD